MDIVIPQWLTKEFIKNSLEYDIKQFNGISIENMNIDMPIPKGDNYTCTIYRVKAEYKITNDSDLKYISLIVKAPSEAGHIKKLGVYEKELFIYSELIPKYRSMFGEKWADITPKSYFSNKGNVVILEDLKINGYIVADRMNQLNFEECKLALASLAKFHAASVKLNEKEPEVIMKAGDEVLFKDETKDIMYYGFIKASFTFIAEECKNYSDLSKYSENIKKYGEYVWDMLIKCIKPKEGDFNVLNHSDYWTTNMMFKYDHLDNKPIDVKLIDLQLCRYSSPAYDILYFVYLAAQESVRIEHYDQLLNIYLENLNMNLELFGSEIRLSKTELLKALNEREYFAVFITIAFLPIMLADNEKYEILDMKELSEEDLKNMGNNSSMNKLYKNDKFYKMIPKRFEEFDKKGLFLIK